jgi:hypothetical protein
MARVDKKVDIYVKNVVYVKSEHLRQSFNHPIETRGEIPHLLLHWMMLMSDILRIDGYIRLHIDDVIML